MSVLDLFTNKKQEKREAEVSRIVHGKKNKYTKDMLKLQGETKKIHRQSERVLDETKKLNIMVTDIASRIAIATGGIKRGG